MTTSNINPALIPSPQEQALATLDSQINAALPTLTELAKLSLPIDTPDAVAQRRVAREVANMKLLALTRPELLTCTPLSVVLAIRRCIDHNLSLDPEHGLVYLTTRQQKRPDGGWDTVLVYSPTADGKLSIAKQAGVIVDNERPTYVLNGAGQVTSVSIRIQKRNGAGELVWETMQFSERDFARWRMASHRDKSRNKPDADSVSMNYANALYTSYNGGIDPEFAAAKALKHGLKKRGINLNEVPVQRVLPEEKIISNPKLIITTSIDEPQPNKAETIEKLKSISTSPANTNEEIL